jgi:hypothetical protein
MSGYDDAVSTLYQAPLDQFVAERKRLAAELKAGGDKEGAARFAKLARPTVSAWAVNQLWWHARDGFDELLASAERLRLGDLAATKAHRDALASLRTHAIRVLTEGGHGAPEGTLRRIATTLSALAANGGFDPDAPGALAADRDPPGFGGAGFDALSAPPPPRVVAPEPKSAPRATAAKHDADARAAAEAERLRLEAERAVQAEAARAAAERERQAERERIKKQAERQRIEAAMRLARRDLDAHTRELERLEQELARARSAIEPVRARVAELEGELARLE